MATLFGVIAIGVFILLIVAVGRNRLAARTQDRTDHGNGGDSA
ncbi:MAG TPA: hypothetical protein VJ790_08770 [Dongiaceae bacterium]|nr:hypothetical protein [Dongiaceae bacterium]